jgi:LPS-assembly lipoprotein
MKARAALVLVAALGLSACGFRPLYGTASIPEGAESAFASIRIAPVAPTNDSDRIGYLVSDALDRALHTPGHNEEQRFELKLALADERRGLSIQDDSSTTRYNYRLIADWTLVPVGSSAALATGRAETTASYNVVDSQYATQIARKDAEDRAAREIAEQVKLRLAVALIPKK